MKNIFTVLFAAFFILRASAQFSVPYYQNFDSAGAAGWSHYALFSTTDNWTQATPPTNNLLYPAFSAPKAMCTVQGTLNPNSSMCLQTPPFDLSNTSTRYALSFYHKWNCGTYGYTYVQYSLDTGQTWVTMADTGLSRIKNWYNSGSNPWFSGNYYSYFTNSAYSLYSIQGHSHVLFRFVNYTGFTSPAPAGWLIDDFSIAPEQFNLLATRGDTIPHFSKFTPTFTLNTPLYFYNQYSAPYFDSTAFFLSRDSILDPGDSLLAKRRIQANYVSGFWSNTFNTPSWLLAGKYYLIYFHDYSNHLHESNENDNISYAVLHVDSTYSTPIDENFESPGNLGWYETADFPSPSPAFALSLGSTHHLENAHSGHTAWNTCSAVMNNGNYHNYLNSEFINLQGSTQPVLSFWYKMNPGYYHNKITYSTDATNFFQWVTLNSCREDDWDYFTIPIPPAVANAQNLQIQFDFNTYNYDGDGIIIDDVYIGNPKSDLSIERDLANRYTLSSAPTDSLRYMLVNSGLAPAASSTTAFYWSTDTILDASDIFLGNKMESSMSDTSRLWTSFTFTKPTTTPGKYYVFYVLDTAHALNEMREWNNVGYFTVYQDNPYFMPYQNDFETQVNGWRHNASLRFADDWNWGTPTGITLNQAFSGSKAWITNAHGDSVSQMSRYHLYSPVFDLSAAVNPVISFDMIFDSYDHVTTYNNRAGGNISYSTDNGATWNVLDHTTQSFKQWYDLENYEDLGGDDNFSTSANNIGLLFAPTEKEFINTLWSYQTRDSKRLTHFVNEITFLAGQKHVQFRFNFASSNAVAEGCLIDNFTVQEKYIDLTVSYKKNLMISSSANQVKFYMDIENNGNYISVPSINNYYLSADTILDPGDVLIGIDTVPAIRPDRSAFVNHSFSSPASLQNYHYLIYSLDYSNANIESNESNNLGWWPLGMDTVLTYPYFNDFSAAQIDGWTWYSDHSGYYDDYRFRHKAVQGDCAWAENGNEWFMDRLSAIPSITYGGFSMMYLESPLFNFSNYDSLALSFDFICVGSCSLPSQGGNMQYSVDGGNTWMVLDVSMDPSAVNWYNCSSIGTLNNESGWFGFYSFTPAKFLLTGLQHQPKVKFRYEIKANYEPNLQSTQGLRLDNFKITAGTYHYDYIAMNYFTPCNASVTQPTVTLNYAITNNGSSTGLYTKTKFYWSTDSIWDALDPLLDSVSENPIAGGTTYNGTHIFTYPIPINQQYYYVFYKADADSIMNESNENNNIGSFKINFSDLGIPSLSNGTGKLLARANEETISVSYDSPSADAHTALTLTDAFGQPVYTEQIILNSGSNLFTIPTANLARGIYFLKLQNERGVVCTKIHIY